MSRVPALAFLAALALFGCGEDDRASAPVRVTPVPTEDAPVPSPTTEIHQSPTPDATAAPTPSPASTADTGGAESGEDTGGAGAGDETGIGIPLAVTIGTGRIRAEPEKVPAFLPLTMLIRNSLAKDVTLVLMLPDGEAAARVEIPANGVRSERVKGLQPGTAELLSPDLDPDATAILTIKRG